MKFCFGLLIVFACPEEKPLAVSDFCELSRGEIVRLQALTRGELAALKRPRKEAILNLRRAYGRFCGTDKPAKLGKTQ